MTILDGKNPRFYFTMPTQDGHWMVACAIDGKQEALSEFLGAEEDAELVCDTFNKREMDLYRRDGEQQVFALFDEEKKLTLAQLVEKLRAGRSES